MKKNELPVSHNEDEIISCLSLDSELFDYCMESLKDNLSKMRYKTHHIADDELTAVKIKKGKYIDTGVLAKNSEPRKSQKAPHDVPQQLQHLFMLFFKFNWPLPDEARQYLANAFEESVRTNSMDNALYLRPERQKSPLPSEDNAINRYINFRVALCEYLDIPQKSSQRLTQTYNIEDIRNVYEELELELSRLFNTRISPKTIESRYHNTRLNIDMDTDVFFNFYAKELSRYQEYLEQNPQV